MVNIGYVDEIQFCEHDLVRSTSDIYKHYGIGRIQRVRGHQAKVEFNPSVFMPPPYRSENKILQLAEVQHVDSPLDRYGRTVGRTLAVRAQNAGGQVHDGKQGRPAFQRTH